MVVPVPVVLQKENVKTLPADVFDHVDSLSAPRLVEYWEQDPCQPPMPPPCPRRPRWSMERARRSAAGQDEQGPRRHGRGPVRRRRVRDRDPVGQGLVGLETWLRQEKYKIPQGAAAALAPYVRDKSKFFVAKVDIKKVKRDAQGVVQLSPLRFYYDANELRLPIRLGLLNSAGTQDLIVYILHPEPRYEVANYTNVIIPTNLEVADGVRNNFARSTPSCSTPPSRSTGAQVVVTEYAWQTTGCDPCPTPPLSLDELATLGLDVLEGIGVAAGPPASPPGTTKPSVAARERARATPQPFFGSAAVVGADAAARALRQGDAVRGPGVPRGEAGDGRARQLERHQRRRGRAA